MLRPFAHEFGARPRSEGSALPLALGTNSDDGATRMRTRIRLTMAAATLVGLTTGLAVVQSGPAAAGATTRVLMVDNEPDLTNWHFEPADVTVTAGSTVLWHNKGKEEHSVTADNKSFDSGWKPKGANYQRTFTRPGTYTYYCAPHPWMRGVVRVVAAPLAPSSTAPTTPAPTTTVTTKAPTTTTTTTAAAPPAPSPEPQDGTETTTSAAPEATTPAVAMSGSVADAPAANHRRPRSARRLAQTIVIVVGPTFGALALGAKLRRNDD